MPVALRRVGVERGPFAQVPLLRIILIAIVWLENMGIRIFGALETLVFSSRYGGISCLPRIRRFQGGKTAPLGPSKEGQGFWRTRLTARPASVAVTAASSNSPIRPTSWF